MTLDSTTALRGGSFIIEQTPFQEVYTPYDFTDEHRMIGETAEQFMQNEVIPLVQEMEQKQEGLNETLLRKAAEIGLVSAAIPEEYGGTELDQISSTIIAEKTGLYGSFATTFGAHSGIGTLPIVYFGTREQKSRYLPKLASAEFIAAYALTEAESGSDALAAQAKAVLSPDGKEYVLNGTKMWITNAGFAQIFITFAKVDGEKFSAFIIERGFPGVSTGQEEHKMGIRGSSTRTLVLENARVPAENLLGELGRGHVIAFNILNFGRFKLGASVVGSVKQTTTEAIRYACQRRQFGKPIIEFGAIQHKLAEMAVRSFCAESMVYRTVGLIDQAMSDIDKNSPNASQEILQAMEEYAVECSIIKVANSEILSYIVDEAVQIHGGYGYSQEYAVERSYRDARINRIFEGTNEINRLLITGMLLKRAMKGQLPLMAAAQKVMGELLSFPSPEEPDTALLSAEQQIIANCKKILLLTAGVAVQKFQNEISEQQEILSFLSDIVIAVFAMESLLLRVLKGIQHEGESKSKYQIQAAQLYVHFALSEVENRGKQILASVSEGDDLRTQLAALRRFAKSTPINLVALRRSLASRLREEAKYCLS